MPTTYNFSGQSLDSETDLLYYGARFIVSMPPQVSLTPPYTPVILSTTSELPLVCSGRREAVLFTAGISRSALWLCFLL